MRSEAWRSRERFKDCSFLPGLGTLLFRPLKAGADAEASGLASARWDDGAGESRSRRVPVSAAGSLVG